MQTRTVSTTLSSYVKHKTYTCRNIKGIISAVKDYETAAWNGSEKSCKGEKFAKLLQLQTNFVFRCFNHEAASMR